MADTKETTQKVEPVADTITVIVNEEERTLFMSFGLLNELTKLVGDPTQVASIPIDVELRTDVLKLVLAKRKKSGKLEEEIDFDDLDIAVADVERVLHWTQEHVISFFVRSLRQVLSVTKNHETEVSNLASSMGGSSDSASKTPSSGRSKSNPAG